MDGTADWTHLLWQELKFRLMMLQATANEFENIFAKIMRSAHGESFHISRPGGPKGDFKCDGWDSATKTLYSVYAPSSAKAKSQVVKKMGGDLNGARKRWPEMRRWRFVHNDIFGLSAEVTRQLESLRSDPSNADLEILADYDPEELWRIVRSLQPADRLDLLGGPRLEAVATDPQWEAVPLRCHDYVSPAATRAAMASLSQLCNNFQNDSVLDPVCSSAMARALTAWWLQGSGPGRGESLFIGYLQFLMDRCDAFPRESQVTSLAFVMRALEICARKLEMPPEVLAESQIQGGADLPNGLGVIFEIAREEMAGESQGFLVDAVSTRRKFVSGCGQAVIHLIGVTSTGTPYPATFFMQDLIISLQRIDFNDGRL
ncbi:hypothetical protein [Phytohabitans suffuscus]|uniref:Uncharacterized protein n=1 Tax=Phytohabitans suffuscus TaxID=624315 RepID=A0A6F8YG31_9ACTN|nr:hypothetical protein [Phytohabitans suffuscus]BCB84901.1 hypothetical protein Psuf_022140 [Phytohabitans suffuscus]